MPGAKQELHPAAIPTADAPKLEAVFSTQKTEEEKGGLDRKRLSDFCATSPVAQMRDAKASGQKSQKVVFF